MITEESSGDSYRRAMAYLLEMLNDGIIELSLWGFPETTIQPVVQYSETFFKCYTGGFAVDTIEKALDLYQLWKEYPKFGRGVWLAKQHGFLPLYWYVDRMVKDGFDPDVLGLPPNPSDIYYRAMAKNFDLSEEEKSELLKQVDEAWEQIKKTKEDKNVENRS